MIKDSVTMEVAGHKYAVPPLLFVAGWIHFVGEFFPFEGTPLPWQEQVMPLSAVCGASINPALYSVESVCRSLSEADDWNLACDPAFSERNKAVFSVGVDGSAKLTLEAIEGWCQIPVQVQQVMLAEVSALVFPFMVAHGASRY